MKLIISLDEDAGRRTFTSLDIVTGSVYLKVRESIAVCHIFVSIQGILQIAPGYDSVTGFVGPQPSRHQKVFETTQTVFPHFPSQHAPVRYTLGKGLHQFRFGINFPLLTSCLNLGELYARNLTDEDETRPLPWLQARQVWADRGRTRLIYQVKATVTKCGFLHRNTCEYLALNFVNLYSPTLVTSCGIFSRKVSQFVSCSLPDVDSDAAELDGCLPLYRPAIVVEAILGGSGNLYRGDLLPLRVLVSLPRADLNRLSIRLRRFQLSLHQVTSSRTEDCQQSKTISDFAIHDIRADLPVDPECAHETVELDSFLWKTCRVPLEVSKFAPSGMPLAHWLQIRTQFSSEFLQRDLFATLLIPIVIEDELGPPRYELVDSDVSFIGERVAATR